jgi:hypothetical protein
MTQQEFTDRTGLTPIPETFDNIHRIYMAAGDMDKDLFCKEWGPSMHDNAIVCALTSRVECLEDRVRLDSIEMNNMVDFLIDQAEKWSASDLREKAIRIIGKQEYLRRKIERGYGLWKKDQDDIIEILSQ